MTAQKYYTKCARFDHLVLLIIKAASCNLYHVESDIRSDLAELLIQYKMTMSAAESCTGGIIGS